MNQLKEYGSEGPLGFPMIDRQARMLETLLKSLPKGKEYEYRRAIKASAPTELNPGERSDVSWISTEAVDRAHEVVLSKGMNDSQFAQNPIVTLNHSYQNPPVGRSLWRKRVKDGDTTGIKAKTKYPEMPANWPQGEPWPSDKVFGYVQTGLLAGKSIGFLPLKVHLPDAKEAGKNGWPTNVLVIDEWLLLEYAVCSMPCNQEAITEIVSKAGPLPSWVAKAIGYEPEKSDPVPPLPPSIPYTSWEEVERIIKSRMNSINFSALAEKAVAEALDRATGRV
jgi:hypothetical protein